jgi:hypothetical protein
MGKDIPAILKRMQSNRNVTDINNSTAASLGIYLWGLIIFF